MQFYNHPIDQSDCSNPHSYNYMHLLLLISISVDVLDTIDNSQLGLEGNKN